MENTSQISLTPGGLLPAKGGAAPASPSSTAEIIVGFDPPTFPLLLFDRAAVSGKAAVRKG